LVSCEGILNLEIVGDGNFVSIKRNFASFSEIDFYDAFELEIRQSDHEGFQEVTVQADANLLRYITTEVNDDRLTIQRMPNYDLFPRKPIRVIVYTDDIALIDVYGNGILFMDSLEVGKLVLNVYSRATVKMNGLEVVDFSVLSNSGGTIQLNGQFDQLQIRQAGSGKAHIEGSALKAEVIQEGSGIIDARTFFTDNISVSLFGSGLIYYNSGTYSSVSIDGNGRVYYSGYKPESITIKGEGRLYEYGP
jgi:hypothetical protein